MNVFQIMAAPTPRWAVFYDPNGDFIYAQKADVIGLIEVETEDGDAAMLPCFMVTDDSGNFFVPEMAVNFLKYTDSSTNVHDMDPEAFEIRKKEIEEIYADINKQTEVQTKRGKLVVLPKPEDKK